MSVSQSINERVYVQKETTWGTVPNSSGTATLAGSNAMRHTKCNIESQQAEIASSDKTGGISQTVGSAGARGASWSIEWEARPHGAAGTVPDCDPILVAAFGADATIVASTSATYNLVNAIKSASIYRFRQPAGVMQQVVGGAVVASLSFAFEQNANCKFSASGSGLWDNDSACYPFDSVGNLGLSSWPTEPAAPVTNGSPVNGLTGSAVIDGSSSLQVKAASITMATAIEVPRDRLFMGQYGSAPERDRLRVTLDLTIVDEDQSYVTGLYVKAKNRTPVDIVLTAGSVAGSRIEWTLKNCILPFPALNDSARKWASDLRGIVAYPTTSTSLDEVKVKFF